MDDCYFPATAMGGRLYLDGAGESYCEEAVVDMLVERVSHRKARTEAELLAVVEGSALGLPAIRVWVGEGLEALARRLREGIWDAASTTCCPLDP